MESKLKTECMDAVGELPNLLLREGGYPHLPTTPIKQEPELTDWFSGFEKPTINGVYERKFNAGRCNEAIWFCKFEDGEWFVWHKSVDDANDEYQSSYFDNLPWRGLAKNPEVQP